MQHKQIIWSNVGWIPGSNSWLLVEIYQERIPCKAAYQGHDLMELCYKINNNNKTIKSLYDTYTGDPADQCSAR